MKIRFIVLPLILVASLFMATGCMDQGDPAWGEKQKTLLEGMLNKPNITHGALVIDNKKKEWVIPNLEVTVRETESLRSFCTVESVTGVGVALEPIAEENGLLAEKIELKGLVCRVVSKNASANATAQDGATQGEATQDSSGANALPTTECRHDSLIVENLKGSKDFQQVLLSFGSDYSLEMLKQASLDRFSLNGISVMMDGKEMAAIESLNLQNLADGFVGPVQVKKLAITPATSALESITLDSFQVKKIGSPNLVEELIKLKDNPSSVAFSGLLMSIGFIVEDMEYQNVSFNIAQDVPPITITKAVGSTHFDGKSGTSSSHMEGLKIDPKTAQYLASGRLKDYAFKPINLSMTTDVGIDKNEGEYSFDYKKIQVVDPALGSLNMNFGLIGGNDLFQISSYGDIPEVKVKHFTVTLEDLGLSDMAFEITSLMSGTGLEGAPAMRMMAAAGLQMQCGQLPLSMQSSCKDTASFIEKKGRIEYSFNPEQPVAIDDNLFQEADKVNIVSKYTPAK